MNYLFILILILIVTQISDCKKYSNPNNALKVYNDIMDGKAPLTTDDSYINVTNKYNKQLRPTGEIGLNKNINQNGTLKITLTVSLRQIVSLDEKQQIITTSLYLLVKWDDPRLMWDPDQYQTTTITVQASLFWIPDLAIVNAASGSNLISIPPNQNIVINYNGSSYLTLSLPSQQTRCKLNVYKYPFDTQKCNIIIGSWMNNDHDIEFSVDDDKFYDDDIYVDHPIWDLKDVGTIDDELDSDRFEFINKDINDRENDLLSNDVQFIIILTRNPLYIMINGIFPCFVLNCVILIAFSLPFSSQVGLCMFLLSKTFTFYNKIILIYFLFYRHDMFFNFFGNITQSVW
jgi:nicotinic acetylcholine receptor beta-4